MNYIDQETLPVFFRGERYYIQGSLILAEAIKVITENSKCQDLMLMEAGFRNHASSSINIVSQTKLDELEIIDPLGYIDIKQCGENKKFYFISTDKDVKRLKDTKKLISELRITRSNDYATDYLYDSDNSIDGFFRSIIEFTKLVHETHFINCSDILFLGLRNWSMCTFKKNDLFEGGEHKIKILQKITKNDRLITASKLTSVNKKGSINEGIIIFSIVPDKKNNNI